MRLQGLFPALATPFADGAVAVDRMASNVERYERLDLAGYLVLGSTGEAPLIDDRERLRVIAAARSVCAPGRTLVAGVCAESTAGALAQARGAVEHGADALLVSTPHYYRAAMSVEALERHFGVVADAAGVPILLYNVPKFTGLVLPLEVVARMVRHPAVIGLKESSGDGDYLAEAVAAMLPGAVVLCGAAPSVRDAVVAGATGAMLAAAAAFPEPCRAVLATAPEDPVTATRQQELAELVQTAVEPYGIAGIKAAMDIRGLYGGDPRPPLLPLDASKRARLARLVDQFVERGILDSREV